MNFILTYRNIFCSHEHFLNLIPRQEQEEQEQQQQQQQSYFFDLLAELAVNNTEVTRFSMTKFFLKPIILIHKRICAV